MLVLRPEVQILHLQRPSINKITPEEKSSCWMLEECLKSNRRELARFAYHADIVNLLNLFSFCESCMQLLIIWWEVKEEEQDDAESTSHDINVVKPTTRTSALRRL